VDVRLSSVVHAILAGGGQAGAADASTAHAVVVAPALLSIVAGIAFPATIDAGLAPVLQAVRAGGLGADAVHAVEALAVGVHQACATVATAGTIRAAAIDVRLIPVHFAVVAGGRWDDRASGPTR